MMGAALGKEVTPQVQIGSISEFNFNYIWSHWYERFEFFCTVNNVSQEKKVPLFLMMIGNEAYSLLKNLCAPEEPKTKSTIELSKIMKNHLEPEYNVITERYNFKKRVQLEQERIKDYVLSLKSLAIKCNFENNFDSCLRDQFIWGLRNNTIKERLLTHEVNLTFKRAVKIATSMEELTENISEMNHYEDSISGDNIIKNSRKQNLSKIMCYCCGNTNHTKNHCLFKNDKCNKCGIIGHLEVVCPEKRLIRDDTSNNKNTDTSTFMRNSNIQNSGKYSICSNLIMLVTNGYSICSHLIILMTGSQDRLKVLKDIIYQIRVFILYFRDKMQLEFLN